ncbi:hypothetical protein SJ05684_c10880 [Sinorhizobium sojae CCBAU 05684]|uniref:Uncharacterized protein n=1 Tax=Sinorhizobium sojae CCBAU 05684 TaxID=716928 RepID=A0A249P9U2_9HYPH|nr:hypothetical protein [Sinorhizobium sojae]ASY62545.1 hypothetical protein SJ05684_c10880 [Sinorhizobium sojae CCBAU 05684]
MKLIADWRAVLRYAWSFRLNILAALLSGLEVWFTFINPESLPIPHGTFAALACVTTILANIARFVAQTSISGGKPDE